MHCLRAPATGFPFSIFACINIKPRALMWRSLLCVVLSACVWSGTSASPIMRFPHEFGLRERNEIYSHDVTASPQTATPKQWKVVWFADKEWEADWIQRVLLSGLPSDAHEVAPVAWCNPVSDCLAPGIAIVVGRAAEEQSRQGALLGLLRAAQAQNSTVIVIHISDEKCDLTTAWYPLVTLVLRQYWCLPQSNASNVVTIPCGVKTGWNYTHDMHASAERSCPWSFYGSVGGSVDSPIDARSQIRWRMKMEMDKVPGGCSPDDYHPEGASYTSQMCNTVIAPCPRGYGFETFRFNEALECGSIPIVDDGGALFHHYMPGLREHVITTTTAWTHTLDGTPLAEHIAALLRDPVGLERRRLATMAWYHRYRRHLLRRIQDAIDG